MSRSSNNLKASAGGRRTVKPKRAKKKYTYPNMTFRPSAFEEFGLRLLKERKKKPMGFFISQGIRIVLEKNNIDFEKFKNLGAKKANED